MPTALHFNTQVLPGHKIKIQSDNLEIGDTVFAEYIDFTLELIQLEKGIHVVSDRAIIDFINKILVNGVYSDKI